MERVTLLGGRKDISGSRKKNRASGHGAASWHERYSPGGNRSSTIRPCYGSGTGAAAAPEPKAPAGSAGRTEQKGGGFRGGVPHMERSSDRQWLQGARCRPEHRGGRRDMRQLSWDQSSGSGTPPAHRHLDAIRHTNLTLGTVYTMARYTMATRPRAEQWKDPAREDLVDLRRRRT